MAFSDILTRLVKAGRVVITYAVRITAVCCFLCAQIVSAIFPAALLPAALLPLIHRFAIRLDISQEIQTATKTMSENFPLQLAMKGFTSKERLLAQCQKKRHYADIGWYLSYFNNWTSSRLMPANTNIWVYIIPYYPHDIDHMNSIQYTRYILTNMTQAERDSVMADENYRRKTFVTSWPFDRSSCQLSGIRMAQAGFYSMNDSDRVQCPFCGIILYDWEEDNDPMTEHRLAFKSCRFVLGLECGNKEYKSELLLEDDIQNVRRVQPLSNTEMHKQTTEGVQDRVLLGIKVDHVKVQFRCPDARLQTFHTWPSTATLPVRMCRAGFYCTGIDEVSCFSCSGGFKDWNENHNPWEEHARYFPRCQYLLQCKGQAYVDNFHSRNSNGRRNDMQEVPDNTLEEQLAAAHSLHCKKCGFWNVSSVWYMGLPCGHLIFCETCNGEELNKAQIDSNCQLECPICCNLLRATFKTFLS